MFITDATNLPRVMNCNGSRLMPPSFPATDILDTTKRDEGNAAHWLAQQLFNGDLRSENAVGTKAYNGIIITSDMVTHVDTYLKALDCGEREATTTFSGTGYTINGRCDHWVYRIYADGSMLTVDDFKYGHSWVEPFENWTLIAHAIGLCRNYGLLPDVICLRIHQPRAWHPEGSLREWRISYTELQEYYQWIDKTLNNPTNQLTTGYTWCRRCPALATCPAARAARMNIIDMASPTFTDAMANDALEYDLQTFEVALKFLEAQVDALKELMAHRIKLGQPFNHYATMQNYGNRRWQHGLTPEFLTMTTGIDCTKTSAITPAEFVRRGGRESVVEKLTERPLIGSKLVRIDADKNAKRILGSKKG